jgi:chemotaxis protein MotB
LVSYADFVTLLFAFFVVMYSISSVNEDKYRVLSDSMESAFHDPKASMRPVQVGQLVRSPSAMQGPVSETPISPSLAPIIAPLLRNFQKTVANETSEATELNEDYSQSVLEKAEAEVNAISDDVEGRMEPWINDDIINIKRNKFWLEIEIKSSLLFQSGSSILIPDSVPLLVELASLFADLPNRIHIEGFTDNKPINTPVFPSNWELSSGRAAAVVRLFARNGVEPARLASIGYGEYQPISDNSSEEARAKNRRVVVVVMASMEGHANERIPEFELLKRKAVATSET